MHSNYTPAADLHLKVEKKKCEQIICINLFVSFTFKLEL